MQYNPNYDSCYNPFRGIKLWVSRIFRFEGDLLMKLRRQMVLQMNNLFSKTIYFYRLQNKLEHFKWIRLIIHIIWLRANGKIPLKFDRWSFCFKNNCRDNNQPKNWNGLAIFDNSEKKFKKCEHIWFAI